MDNLTSDHCNHKQSWYLSMFPFEVRKQDACVSTAGHNSGEPDIAIYFLLLQVGLSKAKPLPIDRRSASTRCKFVLVITFFLSLFALQFCFRAAFLQCTQALSVQIYISDKSWAYLGHSGRKVIMRHRNLDKCSTVSKMNRSRILWMTLFIPQWLNCSEIVAHLVEFKCYTKGLLKGLMAKWTFFHGLYHTDCVLWNIKAIIMHT